jgi:hypothetical protein
MSILARNTDPETSHEATVGVDPIRSQYLVLTFIRTRMPEEWTGKYLVDRYEVAHELGHVPYLSESRIRTARKELERAGLVEHVGFTQGRARRERLWAVTA